MESKNEGKGVIVGATNYVTISKGQNAKDAFSSAYDQAKWEHGHGGYTGTIAEKGSFVEFPRPKGVRLNTIKKVVYGMTWEDKSITKLEKEYPKFPIRQMAQVWNDKWGPSACMELKPKVYIFFGMASE
jgi:hypothetical protein